MTLNLIDGLEPSRLETLSTSSTAPRTPPCDVLERAWASSHGLKMPLDSSGLFNLGDPDLSSCVPADDIIKTESDQLLTVDVSELFPELLGLNEAASGDIKPSAAVDALNLGSGSEMSDAEVSPAETEASLDHFFNTFTDLTGFLENLSAETGPSDLTDNSAVLAGNDNTTTNDTTTAPSVGDLCTSPHDTETEPAEPPAKQACKSGKKAPNRTRQTYRERRNKNNVASRRSRASRKSKFSTMESHATELESDNEHLKKKIVELEKIAEISRKCLIEALSKK